MSSLKLPLKRHFVPVVGPHSKPHSASISSASLRVLQFNVLADGLSGLREDHGGFSRLSSDKTEVRWEHRWPLILQEISQYSPDIVALQECDHYDDCLLPAMDSSNYWSIFAPKPASPCLQVSPRSDGCALFLNKSKLTVLSHEILRYCVPIEDPKHKNTVMQPQNQVAIITVCQVHAALGTSSAPYLIIATTHLKAAKDEEGEQCRASEMTQLLDRIEDVRLECLSSRGVSAAVLLTGDLNAVTTGEDYPALTYRSAKTHALGLRCVYNDDLMSAIRDRGVDCQVAMEGLYSTWKARSGRGGTDTELKHFIDYILYSPASGDDTKANRSWITAAAALDVYPSHEVGEGRLPSLSYPSDHIAIAADVCLWWRS